MMTLTKFAVHLAWPLAVALSILLAFLVASLFVRRGYRHRYFRSLDETRKECGPVLEGLLNGCAGKRALPHTRFFWPTRTRRRQGRPGIERLVEHFVSTEDRYSQQQVAEQFERTGLISPNFLEVLADLERRNAAELSVGTGPEGDSGTGLERF